DLAGEATLWRGLSVGMGLPVALGMTGDRLAGLGLGDERPLTGTALGDLRVRLRYHLLGARAFDLAALVVGTLPLGGDSSFFATPGPPLEPRLVAAWDASRWSRLGAHLGVRFAPTNRIEDQVYSHELHAALGAELHVPRPVIERFRLLAELDLGKSLA